VLPAPTTSTSRGSAGGSEFQGQFNWHVLDKGINHIYIKPRRPRLNGKVERSHRIDEEEFYQMLKGVNIDDTGLTPKFGLRIA
jgi:transposase InsO family protein